MPPSRHLLGWRFILHNGWNAHRFVALCVAYSLLMCNANKRVHAYGAYGRASEGDLLLVDHDQCLTLPHSGVALAWTCRLRPCSSHKQLLCPIHAGDPDIAKPHTYITRARTGRAGNTAQQTVTEAALIAKPIPPLPHLQCFSSSNAGDAPSKC